MRGPLPHLPEAAQRQDQVHRRRQGKKICRSSLASQDSIYLTELSKVRYTFDDVDAVQYMIIQMMIAFTALGPDAGAVQKRRPRLRRRDPPRPYRRTRVRLRLQARVLRRHRLPR